MVLACEACGRVRGGRRVMPLCHDCANTRRCWWTRDRVIAAIQQWAALYGHPPTIVDWTPSAARRRGRDDVAARFDPELYPWATTVQDLFAGSWNTAITVAGYTPRPAHRPCKEIAPA